MEGGITEHVQNYSNDGSDEYSNDEFTSDSTSDEADELHEAYSTDPLKEIGSSARDKGSYSSQDENMQMPELLETCDEDVVAPIASDLLEKEFTSSEDAYKLYVSYARSVGFGVRKGDVRRIKARKITSRSFFCCKEGLRLQKHYVRDDRKRAPKAVTRTNCKARLVIYFDKGSGIWKVQEFVEGHNHELTPRKFVHLIRNHRKITPAYKAQIDTMHKYGMQTCQILGYMAGQCGGYEAIGFSKKDLYNYIDKERRGKIIDGDASEAISYLKGRADVDGMTVARYTITEDERLGNLFWSDGLSRVDYQYFGDVLAFDSTYKKNRYKKPLVIFSGLNHHRQTSIFGFALLGDERIEMYQWLLEQFLDVMANKEPSVVVTNGDESMREAIRRIFPRTTHRLCAWHLAKNAVANIKEPSFCEAFKNCMYNNYTPTQFEERWQAIVERF